MKIGDKLRVVPTARCPGEPSTQPRPCRVVYIHPQRRFFTVEFRSELTGETFRESFSCPDRAEIIRDRPQTDPADKRKQFGPASLRRGGSYTKMKG